MDYEKHINDLDEYTKSLDKAAVGASFSLGMIYQQGPDPAFWGQLEVIRDRLSQACLVAEALADSYQEFLTSMHQRKEDING